MRTRSLLLVAALGLVGFGTALADAPVVAVPTSTVASSQSAAWTKRKLVNFGHPLVLTSQNGPWQAPSCDRMYEDVRYVLLQLGARASDLDVDLRGCYATVSRRSVDVTFSVLVPTGQAGKVPRGGFVDAQWQTVELKGSCDFLHYVTERILPLIPTMDAKLITIDDCSKLGGIGLYTKVLKPAPEPATPP